MTTRIALIRSTQIIIDLFMLSAAIWLGYFIRFDWDVPPLMLRSLVFLWPYVIGIEYAMLFAFGVHRYVWRYVGLREVSRILLATLAATVILLGVRASMSLWFHEMAQHAVLPYGVIAINFTLSFLGVAGVRAGRRLSSEKSKADSRRKRGMDAVPTLLIGAGQGGLIVAKEIDSEARWCTAFPWWAPSTRCRRWRARSEPSRRSLPSRTRTARRCAASPSSARSAGST
jgi:FlaA1/EpsC-like NDP-sugar epimerase